MGGGGGSDGFQHLLEHLGPGTQTWLKDMQEHAFPWTPESIETLGASVAEELKEKDTKALEQRRDELLIGLFQLKNEWESRNAIAN